MWKQVRETMTPDPRSYTAPSLDDWKVMTAYDIDRVYKRLNQLYHDLPLEYTGYALSAIEDIEKIIGKV